MALDQPYRTTILRYYYEGQPSAEIARALRVPAGTVRWRINQGLVQLPRGWTRSTRASGGLDGLAAAPGHPATPPCPRRRPPPPNSPSRPSRPPPSSESAPPCGWGAPRPLPRPEPAARQAPADKPTKTTPDQEGSMNRAHTKLAAFLGVALPALMAAARGREAVEAGTRTSPSAEFRERIVVCKEELSTWADMVPPSTTPEQKERIRQRASRRSRRMAPVRSSPGGPSAPPASTAASASPRARSRPAGPAWRRRTARSRRLHSAPHGGQAQEAALEMSGTRMPGLFRETTFADTIRT